MSEKLHVDASAFTNERKHLYCDKNFTGDSNVTVPLSSQHVNPSSVKLFISGKEEIVPQYFSNKGTPVFSPEASLILYCKERLATEKRVIGAPEENFFITANYQTMSYDFSLEEIDSITGVIAALSDLKSFNELCGKRKAYASKFNKPLHCFVVFGRLMLDEQGGVRRMTRLKNVSYDIVISPDELPIVCSREQFEDFVTFFETDNSSNIPQAGETCPCCGKQFVIDDLRTSLVSHHGKPVHEECLKTYEYYREVKNLIFDIVDTVFAPAVSFEILPNPAVFNKSVAHLPWFMVHTRSGDFKIGSKYDKICIEWQENFKPFDIAILNKFTTATKWYSNSATFKEINPGVAPVNAKRVVCASTKEEAIAILQTVNSVSNFSYATLMNCGMRDASCVQST